MRCKLLLCVMTKTSWEQQHAIRAWDTNGSGLQWGTIYWYRVVLQLQLQSETILWIFFFPKLNYQIQRFKITLHCVILCRSTNKWQQYIYNLTITIISMHFLWEYMYNCILFGRLKHCETFKMCRNTGRVYWQPPRYETQTCNLSSVPCDVLVNWTFRGHWLSLSLFLLHSTE